MQLRATRLLCQLGSPATKAIPTLKELLTNKQPGVALDAALLLVSIDTNAAAPAIPVLIEAVKSTPEGNTGLAAAIKALAKLGPMAKDSLPELVKKYDANKPDLRIHAAEAVARIDPEQAPKAVEVIVALLKEKKQKWELVRLYSANALRQIGAPAKPALPTLLDLLQDDGPFHAEIAAAIIVIDPDGAKRAYDWIRTVLTNPNHDDFYDVFDQLPELGLAAKPLIPDVIELLKSKTASVRRQAVETLAAIGPNAKDALPELKKLAASAPEQRTRELVAEAIKKIEAK